MKLADAPPVANPAADAISRTTRPRDYGAARVGAAPSEPRSGARALVLAAVLLAHGAALAGVAIYQRATRVVEDFNEIPVEIVVEAEPAAVRPTPPTAMSDQALARAIAPPPDFAPPTLAVEAEAASARRAAEAERTVAIALAPPPEIAPEPLAVDRDAERARRAAAAEEARRAEIAHRREAERARRLEAIREQREEAQKLAASRAREQERREKAQARRERAQVRRQRLASLEAGKPASRLAPRDAFDAASYRMIVARGVHAAVARSCPKSGAGRVVVALVIGSSGRIASARLARPSGNGALDAAAVAAVRRSGPFPAPAGRSRVSVPVAVTCR